MLPFLCEISLCCIVSYHFALLILTRGQRVGRNSANQASARRQQVASRQIIPRTTASSVRPSNRSTITSKVTVS